MKIAEPCGHEYQLEPQTTIGDIFNAVQQGAVDKGVVPFENSSNGSVVFTLDLFADLKHNNPDLVVTDEVYVPVHHCLVGFARTKADQQKSIDVSHVKKIYSHPQAWGQCNDFLNAHLKGIERQDVSSTSRGAQIVAAEGPESTSAAISSQLAAQLNGLDVLAAGIEDMKGNMTRFFVLQKPSTTDISIQNSTKATSSIHKTMISFTIEHTSPGALADALAVFKKHNISLTSINTRPSGQHNWMYIFFVEFWGRKDDEGAVDAALLELQAAARSYRWLGSWKSALDAAT